jgi:hypothetical protein
MERDMESESARVTKVPPRADMSCQVRLMGKWISLCLSPPLPLCGFFGRWCSAEQTTRQIDRAPTNKKK